MTKEGFRGYLQPLIDQGMAFCACWHPHGFGVVKTGPIPMQKGKPKQLSAAKLSRWNKNIDRLRRDYAGEVITVIFDGHTLSTEGGIEPWN